MGLIKREINKLLVILFLLGVAASVITFVDVCFTKLNNVTLDIKQLGAGQSIKLLQISDVHNKKSMNSNQQLVRLIQQTQPDIVVITGDLIDDNTKSLEHVYVLVEQIAKINPRIYFVTGNHEWRGGLAEELIEGLGNRGVVVLDNRNEIININNTDINLCGVADWASARQDLESSLKGIDNGNFTVMLAHDPVIIYDYQDFVPDVTLSGHAHGGQIRLPVVGAVVAPSQGLFPKYDKGIFTIQDDKILYVDSGVGTSVLPLRFLNRSQITLITLQ